MLSNKILPDESRAGNENRAHVGKAGRYQMMTPRSADGSIAGGAQFDPANSVKGNEMPPGILGAPMTTDPHRAGRHSTDNLPARAPERPRSQRTEETRNRIYGRTPTYKY
jgi:hypothetical protein